MRIKEMSNKETAEHMREWIKTSKGIFSWPTDACGYYQHMKFVKYRNDNWEGGDFNKFILDYADLLEQNKIDEVEKND